MKHIAATILFSLSLLYSSRAEDVSQLVGVYAENSDHNSDSSEGPTVILDINGRGAFSGTSVGFPFLWRKSGKTIFVRFFDSKKESPITFEYDSSKKEIRIIDQRDRDRVLFMRYATSNIPTKLHEHLMKLDDTAK